MKRLTVAVLGLVVLAGSSYAAWILMSHDPVGRLPHWVQVRPSIYLDAALDHIEQESYGHATVDWTSVRRRATDLAAQATTAEETYGAIRYALGQAPDHLSLVVPPPTSTSG
ncbi:MAG TPA: hypothetical protein VIX35_14210, partial [Vicinamibacterales bacterium]